MNGRFVIIRMFFLFIVPDVQAEFQRFPATYTVANDIGTDGNADPLGNRHLRALNGVTVEVLSLATLATWLIPGLPLVYAAVVRPAQVFTLQAAPTKSFCLQPGSFNFLQLQSAFNQDWTPCHVLADLVLPTSSSGAYEVGRPSQEGCSKLMRPAMSGVPSANTRSPPATRRTNANRRCHVLDNVLTILRPEGRRANTSPLPATMKPDPSRDAPRRIRRTQQG